jgi:pentapeptide MXKDX repeat protein
MQIRIAERAMKKAISKLMILCCLSFATAALAQDAPKDDNLKSDSMKSDSMGKLMSVTGKIGDDGKSFVGDKSRLASWAFLISRPTCRQLRLPSKTDRLGLYFDRNLHFGAGIQVDLLAAQVGQCILNADHLTLMIRSFDRNLRFFRFARNEGFNNGFNRSGQGGGRYLFH